MSRDHAWFDGCRAAVDRLLSKQLFFVGGPQKSGTTWVQMMLDAHPGRCVEVRYEDLVAKPLHTLGPLIHFLGAEASPRQVEACVAAASFDRLSGGRRRGGEDRASFFRRGMPGDWRNHFSDADNRAFLAICGADMARYGYAA